jgi:cytochrome c6
MPSTTRRSLRLAVLVLILSNLPLAAQDAASLYKSKCAACHGADGKGSAMGKKLGVLDFGSPDVQKMSDDQLAAIISDGKGKDMPSYKKSLNPQQTKDLVGYIRSLGKK